MNKSDDTYHQDGVAAVTSLVDKFAEEGLAKREKPGSCDVPQT